MPILAIYNVLFCTQDVNVTRSKMQLISVYRTLRLPLYRLQTHWILEFHANQTSLRLHIAEFPLQVPSLVHILLVTPSSMYPLPQS